MDDADATAVLGNAEGCAVVGVLVGDALVGTVDDGVELGVAVVGAHCGCRPKCWRGSLGKPLTSTLEARPVHQQAVEGSLWTALRGWPPTLAEGRAVAPGVRDHAGASKVEGNSNARACGVGCAAIYKGRVHVCLPPLAPPPSRNG